MLQNLKKLRIQKQMTQKALADVVGTSQQSINKYENHNVEPDIAMLKKLAAHFDTTIDYIVGYSDIQIPASGLEPDALTGEEALLLTCFRSLDRGKQQAVCELLRQFSS